MKVYILGIDGNMGRRYKAVLNYLGHEVSGHDRGGAVGDISKYDAVIIATPTVNHLDDIWRTLARGKPILCEKPFTTDIDALRRFARGLSYKEKSLVSMVNQYDYLVASGKLGVSYYDYFKSGSDGLHWDCINISGLSLTKPVLNNNLPIWACGINGQPLSIESMDLAYINMIDEWLHGKPSNFEYAVEAHEKVARWFL